MPKKITLEDCKLVAIERNGECLSTQYKSCGKDKLIWKCQFSHQWIATLNKIKAGRWCPYCAKAGQTAKHTIKYCQQIAIERKGECLSTEYKNLTSKMLWSCFSQHSWSASFSSILHENSWCPYCTKKAKYSIEYCQQIAIERKGECLSTEYKSNLSDLLWRCQVGHLFLKDLSHILSRNQWCPNCRKFSKSEYLTRTIFEEALKIPFINCRPSFMKGLELDGYNEEKKIAFEYNGEQHYKFIEWFHISEDRFKEQQERDKRKQELCIRNNIRLYTIPYHYNYTDPDNLKKYIIAQLMQDKLI